MKILVVCEYYAPERVLITEIAERLVQEGHSVTVLTGKPNYGMPGGKVLKEYRKRDVEEIGGVRILRCSVFGRGTNKVRLLLNYFSFMVNATRKAKRLSEEYDVVLCYQLTPIFQMHPAIRYCQAHHKRLLCYCLDLAPESGSMRIGKVPVVSTLYARYARWAYNQCDAIAVTSPTFVGYLHQKNGVPVEKLTYLPQHASPALLSQDLYHERGERAEFMFAGNIGNGPRLETIVKAAAKLVQDGEKCFHVTFIGDGSAKEKLKALVKERQLESHVSFRNGVPMDQMADVYRSADVLLVTLRKGQITIPGKLQAYMATGKPIIGAMDGSGCDLIEQVGCGTCARAEDAEGLARKMKEYIDKPEAYSGMGERGRQYFAEHFSLDKYITGMIGLLGVEE